MKEQNNRIYLETDRLKLILSEHKDEIGKRAINGIEMIIAAIAFWIPMAISDFSKWKTIGSIIQIILVISGIVYTCYAIYYTFCAIKNPFNKDKKQDIGLSSIVLLLGYSVRTVIYFCLRLLGLAGIVILS